MRELGAVKARDGGSALGEAATMDPEHHRQMLAAGRPDVERQAVFALREIDAGHQALGGVLRTGGAEGGGVARGAPMRTGLRRLPAQIADGRRSVGNVLVDIDRVDRGADERALIDGDAGRGEDGCGENESRGKDERAHVTNS